MGGDGLRGRYYSIIFGKYQRHVSGPFQQTRDFFGGQRPGVRKKKPQMADFGRDFDDRHARGADDWLGPAERL